MDHYLGEIAALLTALCWTITAMAFESAGKRVGALSLNLIRLVIGLVFLSIYNGFVNGEIFPTATNYQWFWLALSGLIGFVLGDLFLFRAFILSEPAYPCLLWPWSLPSQPLSAGSPWGKN